MSDLASTNADRLSALPARRGFRQRGMEMTRLETFTDAAFAFAVTLLLIFVVLIYVYPLKAIYSGAIEFFSNGYFASYFGLRSLADLRDLFVVFGLGFAGLSGIIVLLNRHAWSLQYR